MVPNITVFFFRIPQHYFIRGSRHNGNCLCRLFTLLFLPKGMSAVPVFLPQYIWSKPIHYLQIMAALKTMLHIHSFIGGLFVSTSLMLPVRWFNVYSLIFFSYAIVFRLLRLGIFLQIQPELERLFDTQSIRPALLCCYSIERSQVCH